MVRREYILDEIRRTARENGGVPLGRSRFYASTGIKEADWHGRYWARWSDAIREAGFQPNQLRAAHGEDFLLQNLALLVRELGRFPVTADIKLKARTTAGFPDPKTFRRRGTRTALAAKLLQFYEADTDFSDVVEICREVSKENAPEADQPQPEEHSTFGSVYLLKSGRYFKVGRSNSVGRREYELAIQLPEKASLVHSIKTDDPIGIEEYWHKRFAERRKNGEWFELTTADVSAFKRRRFM